MFYEENIHIIAYNSALRPLKSNCNKNSNLSKTPFLDVFEKKHLTPILPANKESKESNDQSTDFPEIFKTERIYFQSGVKDKKKLLQFVYAFGGEVVDVAKDASVVILDDTTGSTTMNNGVKVQWLLDSIKSRKRMDTKIYLR